MYQTYFHIKCYALRFHFETEVKGYLRTVHYYFGIIILFSSIEYPYLPHRREFLFYKNPLPYPSGNSNQTPYFFEISWSLGTPTSTPLEFLISSVGGAWIFSGTPHFMAKIFNYLWLLKQYVNIFVQKVHIWSVYLRAYLLRTTFSHATSLRQACDMS